VSYIPKCDAKDLAPICQMTSWTTILNWRHYEEASAVSAVSAGVYLAPGGGGVESALKETSS
jgi:hypothetical protein